MKEKSFLKKLYCGEYDKNRSTQYFFNFALMLSQVLSVLLGGDPDESVSCRTGKASKAGKWWFVKVQEPFINWLFRDPKHCRKAIEPDEGAREIWHWSR